MKRISAFLITLALLASCASTPLEVQDCTDLAGDYRATSFGFVNDELGLDEDFGDDAVFDIGFNDGTFDSDFSATGFDPIRFEDETFAATENSLTFNEPLVDRVEPGVQTLDCEVVDDNTFRLRDTARFDFDNDGVFEENEEADFEGTFEAL